MQDAPTAESKFPRHLDCLEATQWGLKIGLMRVARCGCGSSEMAMLEKVNGGMVGGSFFNQGFSHERMLFFRVFFSEGGSAMMRQTFG